MKSCLWIAAVLLVLGAGLEPSAAADDRIAIMAAENFYGDVAKQIGGDRVSVTSVLNNPDQDPHLFETSPSVAREISAAQIVIYNGADYDPWMEKLLKITSKPKRGVINVSDLLHRKAGDNPHFWYDPAAMPALARVLAGTLSAIDPAHSADYASRLKKFLASLEPLNDKIARTREKYAGVAVTATEPVFGYMADALHLVMLHQRFQLAIMNNTEPSAADLGSLERDLKAHRVRVLFFNKQASDSLVGRVVEIARAANIPVVGVTETCPLGRSYQDWIEHELDQTEGALLVNPS
jgi:zinc/manganese transport system substrate-binding protein